MPRQIRATGMSHDALFFDEFIMRTQESRAGAPRLTPEAERALAESSRFRGPITLPNDNSDYVDIIRYRILEERIAAGESLDRILWGTPRRMEESEPPTDDRLYEFDADGAVRFLYPDPSLTRESLRRARDAILAGPVRRDDFLLWKMVGYDTNGVITAECFRAAPTCYEAYCIDPVQSRSTGIVCYSPDSKQPMNGKPREEFETWALKELEKGIRVEKWPPF